jgi:hypothetical protein
LDPHIQDARRITSVPNTKTNSTSGSENPEAKRPRQPQPTGYEIRVRDHLETYWLEWFEGWLITNLENGEFLLKSANADQSMLHGALNKIRDLNLTLLAVRCVPTDNGTVLSDGRGEHDQMPNPRKNIE